MIKPTMNYIKEYNLKQELKKKIDEIILDEDLPTKVIIEMLEELTILYKN